MVPGRFSLPWLAKRAPMKLPYSGHEWKLSVALCGDEIEERRAERRVGREIPAGEEDDRVVLRQRRRREAAGIGRGGHGEAAVAGLRQRLHGDPRVGARRMIVRVRPDVVDVQHAPLRRGARREGKTGREQERDAPHGEEL
jgi:hypothetical protein